MLDDELELDRGADADGPRGLRAQLAELARVVRWLLAASAGARTRLARVVALDLVSAAASLVALAGLLALLGALEAGGALTLGPLRADLEGAAGFLGAALAFAALGAGAAGLQFAARSQSAAMSRQLVLGLRARVAGAVVDGSRARWNEVVEGPPKKWARRLLAADAAAAGLGLWSFLNGLFPLGLLVGAAAYLVALDPPLTGLVGLALAPFALGLAVAWARLAHTRRRYLAAGGDAIPPLVEAVGAVAAKPGPTPTLRADVAGALDAPVHREAVALFFELRLAVQRVRLIVGVASVAAVAVVLAWHVPHLGRDDAGWTDPIAYVVAMRVVLQAAERVASALAMISRRVPEIDRLAAFLDGAAAPRGDAR
jgi:hypothetical protein